MEPQKNNSGQTNNSTPEQTKQNSQFKQFGPAASNLAGNIANSANSAASSAANAASKVATPIKNAMPASLGQKRPKGIKKFFSSLKTKWSGLSRRKKALVLAIAFILLAAIAYGIYTLAFKSPAPVAKSAAVTKTVPKPTTVASPLTGVQVQPALAKRPVTGIMVENSTDARPQSGMQEAGVVVEAIAEGGITRFLNLFQESTPQYIGPVRSLRPYYLDFAAAFQASIAHVGGSPDALSRVRNGNYRDIDQFFNSSYYTRISARDTPHNVYTSFDNLDKLNQSKGYTASTFTSWTRKAEAKLATPTASKIDVNISSFYYNSHYDYDATTNTYLRSEGGAVHKNIVSATDKTGVQLAPKIVMVLVMATGIGSDGQHTDYQDTGTGNAYVFQDGGVTVGKWSKASQDAQISFTDNAGAVLKLNPGQTWITLVGSDNAVTYSAPAPAATPAQ